MWSPENGERGMEYGEWIIVLGCVRLSERPGVRAGGLLAGAHKSSCEMRLLGCLGSWKRTPTHTSAARSDQVRVGRVGLADATSRSVPSGSLLRSKEEFAFGIAA